MSLFLGKIHFWLFDKIKCFEDLEREIIDFADKKGKKQDLKIDTIYELVGTPTPDKKLDEMIDTSNIHGWLQEQIQNAEKRQAYIIKNLKAIEPSYIDELKSVFENHGRKSASSFVGTVSSPKEAYEAMNNFVLEGMPCDRITDFVEDSEDRFSFVFVRCLHKKYWDEFDADIRDFYTLRNEWIKGFVNTLNNNLDFVVDVQDDSYVDIDKNTFSIVKK